MATSIPQTPRTLKGSLMVPSICRESLGIEMLSAADDGSTV